MARSNEKVEVRYRMRHDQVLIRITPVGQVRGLFMPEASMQGVQYVVEELGPKVKDLKKGDVVLIKGTPGRDIGLLPNDSRLLVASEENILLVVEPSIDIKDVPEEGYDIGGPYSREDIENSERIRDSLKYKGDDDNPIGGA